MKVKKNQASVNMNTGQNKKTVSKKKMKDYRNDYSHKITRYVNVLRRTLSSASCCNGAVLEETWEALMGVSISHYW